MKPIFHSQIEPDLTIVDFWLTPDSLVIQYVFRGNDYDMDLNQGEAIDLLKKYGLIEDERMLDVKVIDEDGKGIWIPWHDYANNSGFTEFDARQIIIGEISDASLKCWASDFDESLTTILNSYKPVSV